MPQKDPLKPDSLNVMAKDVKSAESYANLGRLHDQQEQWQAAIANYRQAIKLNPHCSWFYHHLADVFFKREQWQDAITNYRHAIKLNPNFSGSYHNLGNSLLKLKHWEEAVHVYRKAIELNPHFHWSYCNLADGLIQQKKWNLGIINYWKSLVILHQTNQEQDFVLIATKLGETLEYHLPEKFDLAIAHYQKVVQNHQQYPEYQSIIQFLSQNQSAWLKIADFFQQKYLINAALILYKMAIECYPDQISIAEKFNTLLQKKTELETSINLRHQNIDKHSQKWSKYDDGITNITTNNFNIPLATHQQLEQFIFSTDINFDLNQLDQLFEAVGWMTRDHENMKTALETQFFSCYPLVCHPHPKTVNWVYPGCFRSCL
ncbi:MAG: tetratricopeptide repeat protein [Planktothrix sp. GU0601_MAG3]|nr:MAG: tetratricopeptide repeat protein [Planktothrix sp. GU0601_MAG3]